MANKSEAPKADATPATVPAAWDWQHVGILLVYSISAFGVLGTVIQTAIKHSQSGQNITIELIGVSVMLANSVANWFKLRPNSIEEAVADGKLSVSQATQILVTRAPIDPDKTKPM